MVVTTRTVTTHTLKLSDLDVEFDLEYSVDNGEEPIVKEKPGGGYVVGYLSRDTDPQHPLEDCDGMGKVIDGRHNFAAWKERASGQMQRGWMVTNAPRGFVCHRPLDVMLDVYDHGGEVWRLTGGGTYFPDEQWDVSHCAGVWVPDDCCEEHIKSTAIMKCLPEQVKVAYKSQEPYGQGGGFLNRIVIEFHVGDALKELFRVPERWNPDEHSIVTIDNRGKGYKSFESAARAACKIIGVKPTKDDLARGRRALAIECAEQAVEALNSYCSGDVWGVCVETYDEEGDRLTEDACWGHVGEEWAKQALEENMNYHLKHED